MARSLRWHSKEKLTSSLERMSDPLVLEIPELEVIREVEIKNLDKMASSRPSRDPPKMGDFTFAEFNLKRLVKFGLSRPPTDIPYVNFKELYKKLEEIFKAIRVQNQETREAIGAQNQALQAPNQ
ncbi:hypothetical protein LAZ67_3005719 [Cordylochernes scorpioides]|uniref:Uncharacterized protein n=1 Tax=Cordylochernes scorpioides TaxID=51811 RepID=A0ABY6KAI6_9ARAC|nr:hypothetical protein LAZ67_3005719 [Cordylochernes scorpioides]